MSAKVHKIKKKKKGGGLWSKLAVHEKILLLLIVLVAFGSTAYIAWSEFKPEEPTEEPVKIFYTPEERESNLTTEGQWELFTDFGFQVWVPSSLPRETLDETTAKYCRTFARKDKGGSPELSFGVFVYPDTQKQSYDVEANAFDVIEMVNPMLQEIAGNMIVCKYPALATDVWNSTLEDGTPILEGKGTLECQMLYQNPKTGEVYTEMFTTNIYYITQVFNERPLVCWGTWDYSTYLGEEDTKLAVKEAAASLAMISGMEPVGPDATVVALGIDDTGDPWVDLTGKDKDEDVTYYGPDGEVFVDGQDGQYIVDDEGYITVDGERIKVEGWEQIKEQIDKNGTYGEDAAGAEGSESDEQTLTDSQVSGGSDNTDNEEDTNNG